jgi:hypothetical protein
LAVVLLLTEQVANINASDFIFVARRSGVAPSRPSPGLETVNDFEGGIDEVQVRALGREVEIDLVSRSGSTSIALEGIGPIVLLVGVQATEEQGLKCGRACRKASRPWGNAACYMTAIIGGTAMDKIAITEHSIIGWQPFKEKAGFVPDPMILRAGEIFLNGQKGSQALGRNDVEIMLALKANIGGLVDFFDMVVTRKTIPLINYTDTFAPLEAFTPIEQMLGEQICVVTVAHEVYIKIKRGALIGLAQLDWDKVPPHLEHDLAELNAFLYNWQPGLHDVALDAAQYAEETAQLAALQQSDPGRQTLARFLLGGLIFSGFAQASGTIYQIQPKRSRFYLGLTATPERLKRLTNDEEDGIFDAAEASLKGSDATVQRVRTLPPVLPYLLEEEPQPRNVQELLTRALKFADTSMGKDYLALVEAIRKDGVGARRAADISAKERQRALALLSPYSRLDSERSEGLEIGVEMKGGVAPTPAVKYKLSIPRWLKVWWNDNVDFGWPRQNLRRMWMASESYRKLSSRVEEVWKSS